MRQSAAKPQPKESEYFPQRRKGRKGKNGKFEARNPKLETISNDKNHNVLNKFVSDFEFCVSNFEFVSDFDIRISDLASLTVSRQEKRLS
jgi:hypothetical protein